ncbi:MAG: histidine phosphatase family protein [Desulfobacterales bacterium]|nr:histidine phosphatase family protein [Desulfobacterales bacterium]
MSIIYMIRHAQASFGSQNYDQLSDLGKKQAQILATYLNRISIMFDSIYTGMQLRHAQTLSAYQKLSADMDNHIPSINATSAFNEYDAEKVLKTFIPILLKENPSLRSEVDEMLTNKRKFQNIFSEAMLRWIKEAKTVADLESWETFSDRVYKGIKTIMLSEGRDKKIAVFTSGGAISATIQKSLNLSNNDTLMLSWQIVNTSITRFKFRDNRLILFGFNDFNHLEIDNEEKLITYR